MRLPFMMQLQRSVNNNNNNNRISIAPYVTSQLQFTLSLQNFCNYPRQNWSFIVFHFFTETLVTFRIPCHPHSCIMAIFYVAECILIRIIFLFITGFIIYIYIYNCTSEYRKLEQDMIYVNTISLTELLICGILCLVMSSRQNL